MNIDQSFKLARRATSHLRAGMLIASAALLFNAPASADQALATARSCMAGHAVDRKLVGPSFKDVASRYKTQANAADIMADKIRNGSAGAWGAMPMPANRQVNEADARKLADWILGLS